MPNPRIQLPRRRAVAVEAPDDVILTCRCIDEQIARDCTRPWVVEAARQAASIPTRMAVGSYEGRRFASLQGIHAWVMSHIAYVHDPHKRDASGKWVSSELIADCENIMRTGAGDCDEHTILVGAMCRALGFHPVYIMVGGRRGMPEHVFPEVVCPGRGRVTVDTTIDKGLGRKAGDHNWTFWQWHEPPRRRARRRMP